jgi:histone H3/H4
MRVKQTARKSTATKDQPDPLQSRLRVLETKRSSLGSSASTYIRQHGASTSQSSRHSIPAACGLGSRGKHISIDKDVKVKPRAVSGDVALKEIKRLRSTTDLLIPRTVFHRLVREITQDLGDGNENIRYQVAALMALQEATEHYMTNLFEDAYLCTLHAKRVTLFTRDMDLCRRLRERS